MFLLLFSVALFVVYDLKISPLIVKYAGCEAGTKMNNYINTAINGIIKSKNIDTENLTKINYNKSGTVSSVNINTPSLNEIKANLNNSVQSVLGKDSDVYVKFPIGNVFNSSFLVGLGPDVNLKIKINSSVVTDVKTEFKAAGINQTLHRVIIVVNNNACLMMPLFKKDIDFKTPIVVSETVIVGEVPDSFTSVNDYEDGKIADYIANYAGE